MEGPGEPEEEKCCICFNRITGPCSECEDIIPAVTREECPVSRGVCNHRFHFHCISRWLEEQNICPLDRRSWTFEDV
ncbi:RING-box protein 1-like [Ictalurus punctatus]|uniref:cullin-RING-type E3 NEDD8 transferase n=1 Tax=Ictalurus punctatus TaxID=7998 RepID=A0A2D0T4M1_ICTPU|nr:RING-box protein 1-like [Ictalurus punctatus]